MDNKIKEGTRLWQYLSPQQKALYKDGEFLVLDCDRHIDDSPTDFSYLVFPFAKLYEGFLKQLFLDLDIITKRDYNSDHFRIGKSLSPNMARKLHYSAYRQIEDRYGGDLAYNLWKTWREGRNLVFHYFPHNIRSLTKAEAMRVISLIINTMSEAVTKTNVRINSLNKAENKEYIGRFNYYNKY